MRHNAGTLRQCFAHALEFLGEFLSMVWELNPPHQCAHTNNLCKVEVALRGHCHSHAASQPPSAAASGCMSATDED